MGDPPAKLMEDAFHMYNSRVKIAVDERKETFRKVGMYVMMDGRTKIEPDMRCLMLDRDQLVNELDMNRPEAQAAVAMFDQTRDDQIPFGVVMNDGGAMALSIRVGRRDGNDDDE